LHWGGSENVDVRKVFDVIVKGKIGTYYGEISIVSGKPEGNGLFTT
jgi:hypothetical protein